MKMNVFEKKIEIFFEKIDHELKFFSFLKIKFVFSWSDKHIQELDLFIWQQFSNT